MSRCKACGYTICRCKPPRAGRSRLTLSKPDVATGTRSSLPYQDQAARITALFRDLDAEAQLAVINGILKGMPEQVGPFHVKP